MSTIGEKLSLCVTPGEIQRMVRGTGWEIVDTDELQALRKRVVSLERALTAAIDGTVREALLDIAKGDY